MFLRRNLLASIFRLDCQFAFYRTFWDLMHLSIREYKCNTIERIAKWVEMEYVYLLNHTNKLVWTMKCEQCWWSCTRQLTADIPSHEMHALPGHEPFHFQPCCYSATGSDHLQCHWFRSFPVRHAHPGFADSYLRKCFVPGSGADHDTMTRSNTRRACNRGCLVKSITLDQNLLVWTTTSGSSVLVMHECLTLHSFFIACQS